MKFYCCSSLLVMFMHGFKEWEKQREQEQAAMFKESGIALDDLGKMGYEGLTALLRDMRDKPDKVAAMEKFLADHPELNAMSQAQCRAAEQAAQDLLLREDARVLLPTPQEVTPWFEVLAQRLMEAPEKFDSSRPPNEATHEAFADLVYDVASEMAKAVFTPARRNQMISHLQELQRRFFAEGNKEALAGVNGAFMAVQSITAPEDNDFLVSVCWVSLRKGMESMAGSSDDDEVSVGRDPADRH